MIFLDNSETAGLLLQTRSAGIEESKFAFSTELLFWSSLTGLSN